MDDFEDLEGVPVPIHLPLERLDRCRICKTEKYKLRLCEVCKEVLYCSRACQKADWARHRLRCNGTVGVDLRSFYPVFALFYDRGANVPGTQMPKVLCYQLLKGVTPDTTPRRFPDGHVAKRVVFSDTETYPEIGGPNWWPEASPYTEIRLTRRITRSGWLVPKIVAACVAVACTLYSGDPFLPDDGHHHEERIRLLHNGVPISDFGIANGSVSIPPHHKLVYVQASTGEVSHGQDPDNHYWFYFTLINGQTIILDCGLFPWDGGFAVQTKEYKNLPDDMNCVGRTVPAYFTGSSKAIRDLDSKFRTTRYQFSILREPRLRKLLRSTKDPSGTAIVTDVLVEILEQAMQRKVEESEFRLTDSLLKANYASMYDIINNRAWEAWPKCPSEDFDDTHFEALLPSRGKYMAEAIKKWMKSSQSTVDSTYTEGYE